MGERQRHSRGGGRWRVMGGVALASVVMIGTVATDGFDVVRSGGDLARSTAAPGDGAWSADGATTNAPVHRRWSANRDGEAPGSTSDGRGAGDLADDDAALAPATTPGPDAAGDGADAATAPTAGVAQVPATVPTVPVPGSAVATASAASSSASASASSGSAPLAPSGWAPASPGGGVGDAAPGGNASGRVCEVEPLAPSVGLDAFYTQVCWAEGIPVVSSAEVEPLALQAAADIVVNMLRPRPDLRDLLIEGRLRVGIIGEQQRAVDLPEYRDLPTSFPDTNWDAARAYGATPRRPLLAVPEENLLCSPRDTYPGQSVLVHELGHTVLDMAVVRRDAAFESRIQAAYRAARSNPVYVDTYAMVNTDEYWAEGVQDFFDASRAAYGPNGGGDGYDGPIASRDALRSNDPALYALVASVFTESPWRPSCPS